MLGIIKNFDQRFDNLYHNIRKNINITYDDNINNYKNLKYIIIPFNLSLEKLNILIKNNINTKFISLIKHKDLNQKNNIVLLDNKDYLNFNSLLTAEGLISIIINKTKISIFNKKILIIGYGNTGSKIYELISNLTNLNNSKNNIFVYSNNIENKNYLNREISININYDIIINTVDNISLENNFFKDFKGYFFDIASNSNIKTDNEKYFLEPKIPSRFFDDENLIFLRNIIFNIIQNGGD